MNWRPLPQSGNPLTIIRRLVAQINEWAQDKDRFERVVSTQSSFVSAGDSVKLRTGLAIESSRVGTENTGTLNPLDVTGSLIPTINDGYDIGMVFPTRRWKSLYLSRNIDMDGSLDVAGNAIVAGTLAAGVISATTLSTTGVSAGTVNTNYLTATGVQATTISATGISAVGLSLTGDLSSDDITCRTLRSTLGLTAVDLRVTSGTTSATLAVTAGTTLTTLRCTSGVTLNTDLYVLSGGLTRPFVVRDSSGVSSFIVYSISGSTLSAWMPGHVLVGRGSANVSEPDSDRIFRIVEQTSDNLFSRAFSVEPQLNSDLGGTNMTLVNYGAVVTTGFDPDFTGAIGTPNITLQQVQFSGTVSGASLTTGVQQFAGIDMNLAPTVPTASPAWVNCVGYDVTSVNVNGASVTRSYGMRIKPNAVGTGSVGTWGIMSGQNVQIASTGRLQLGQATNTPATNSLRVPQTTGTTIIVELGSSDMYAIRPTNFYGLSNGHSVLGWSNSGWHSLVLTGQTFTGAGVSNGQFWHDGPQHTLAGRISGMTHNFTGTLLTQTADVSVGNTTTETNMLGAGIGNSTLAANLFAVGKTLRVGARGVYGTTDTGPTLRVRLKMGTTSVLDTTALTLPAGLSNRGWEVSGLVTCRTTGTTGTVMANGFFKGAMSASGSSSWDMENPAVITVGTAGSHALSLSAEWGTGDTMNTITCSNFIMEALN